MITPEELNEWKKDVNLADKTHPNSFANGPFLRSLFKVSQNIDTTGQFLGRLSGTAHEINISLSGLKKVIEDSNNVSGYLAKKVFWLNVVLAIATIIGAIATVVMAIPVIVELFGK